MRFGAKNSIIKAETYTFYRFSCYTDSVKSVGGDDGKVPPVPIPNTEVKLTCAEDS